jgi:hypothetical protein
MSTLGKRQRSAKVRRLTSRVPTCVECRIWVERPVSETIHEFFAKCFTMFAAALRSAGLLLFNVGSRFGTEFYLRHLTVVSGRGSSAAGNAGSGGAECRRTPGAIATSGPAAAEHDLAAKHAAATVATSGRAASHEAG